jgi:RND family efflux transporter MFP subunit
MNPIDFALRRPWTVVVGVVALLLLAGVAVRRMRIDVFPSLNAPVVYVCQPYGGMDPGQMEGLLTNYYEYHFLYIAGIHHVESRSVQGMAIMKLVFHPGTDMAQAMAETIGYVTRSRAFMPPGTVSPFITRFDGGSVPVGYLVLSSATKSIGEIQDQALFKVRPMFASLPGVSAPPPFGGSQRTVVVRLDPDRLKSLAMAPDEVITALSRNNVISPSGVIRVGDEMPIVSVNALVREVGDLLDIPIRRDGGTVVFLRDVATVADASDVPTGYALVNGRRAVYILVTKRADASTLSVVAAVKQALPDMKAVLPDDIDVGFEFDQSPTVTNAIMGLVTEAIAGAGLIGLVVLLFLRDVRSALVVVITIPCALAGALVGLWLTGQSLNLMTLGGLALAVGIVVDEATVEIENIHAKLARLAGQGRAGVALAVRQGNMDTAVPRLLAMLCVVAVFLPSFFMEGTARALFVPLSLAVGFAMTSSYLLSSTLVPVAAAVLLRAHRPAARAADSLAFDGTAFHGAAPDSADAPRREPLRDAFAAGLRPLVGLRWLVVPAALAGCVAGAWFTGRQLGLEIFPRVDAGRFQLRIEAPTGTRIEKTEEIVRRVLGVIDDETGGDAVEISVGYAGLIPSSYPINAIYQWTGGPEEAVLRVALRPEAHVDVAALTARLRERLADELPGVSFSFEPADIVSEVMSFGSPTPVEVAVSGPNFDDTKAHAERIRAELAAEPVLRDVRYGQALDYPAIRVAIDRRRAGASDVTAEQIARSLVAATSSSRFVVPNYWPDPKSGIGYQVQVEIPYEIMQSVDDIATLPVDRGTGGGPGGLLLRDVADVTRTTMPGQFDRYNMKRTVSLTANVVGTDLGRAAARVAAAVTAAGEPPRGVKVDLRGQVAPLWEILRGLAIGLVAAVAVILLVLTAAFQSFFLAVVALAAAPAVIAGVAAALWLTGTTINLQSFMGSIMALGVSTANAILLVSFAERERRGGATAAEAAVTAARDRLRPILMTSIAMIVGMVPLAIGTGEGGEQTAPLGRAVIGGLLASTAATLLLLPGVFALVMGRASRETASLHPFDPASGRYAGAAAAAAAAMLLLAVVGGCGPAAPPVAPVTPAASQPAPSRREPPVAAVTVATPTRATLRRMTTQPGQIEPFESTRLHAKLGGYVERVLVDIGDVVADGDVLVELALPEVAAERDQKAAAVEQAVAALEQATARRRVADAGRQAAEAGVAEARAAILRTEAEVVRRQSELDRTLELVKEGAVTAALADEMRSLLAAARASRDEVVAGVRSADARVAQAEAVISQTEADIEAAAATVAVAKADLTRVEALLGYGTLRAPFPGVIRSRLVHPGHLAVPGGSGGPLLELERQDRLRVVVPVPELDAAFVEVGNPVEIRLQAVPGLVLPAAVARTAGSLDESTRTLRVEVDLDNTPEQAITAAGTAAAARVVLRPGLYATTTIVTDRREDVLVVPAAAVVRDGGESFCFVLEQAAAGDPSDPSPDPFPDAVARRRPVTTGLTEGGLVEITGGLDGSERVVTAGAAALADGQAVRATAP